MREGTLYEERTNLRAIVLTLALLMVGLLTIGVSRFFAPERVWYQVIHELGVILVATSPVAILWELFAKRALLTELLAATKLAERIRAVGLVGLATDWNQDIPWRQLFRDTTSVDIFVAYGITWRGVMGGILREFAARHGTACRVVLPDADSEAVMSSVACQLGKTSDEVKARVTAAKDDFGRLIPQCERWYSARPPMFSFYIFDTHAVLTLYRHRSDPSDTIGLVVRKGGEYYGLLRKEFDSFVKGPEATARRV